MHPFKLRIVQPSLNRMTGNSPKRHREIIVNAIMWLSDLIAIWLAVIILLSIFDHSFLMHQKRIALTLATVAYIPTCLYMSHGNALLRTLTLDKVFLNSFKAIIIHALTFMSLSAFIHYDYSMTFYCSLYLILSVAFPTINLLCRKLIKVMRSRGRNRLRVAVAGTGYNAVRLGDSLVRDTGFGYDLVGFFGESCPDGFKGKYIGDFTALEQYAREHRLDEIYYTPDTAIDETMPRVVRIAEQNMLQFHFVPQVSRYVSGIFGLQTIGPVPVMTLRRSPLSFASNRWLKRTFDIVFSSVVLLFSPIIFIPVAIGIKMSSPGPVFFRQERTGYKGNTFYCYKFRTMRVNKDADKAQATANDPRKTRFGDFLRRSSIDELPQFINVWLGDMSVVGPRPHMLKHTEDYTRLIDKYMVRHVIKPGITGWAQVNGYRGITDQLWKMERRVECDVWYIENWTFTLDLKIVFRTVFNAFKGEKNAF